MRTCGVPLRFFEIVGARRAARYGFGTVDDYASALECYQAAEGPAAVPGDRTTDVGHPGGAAIAGPKPAVLVLEANGGVVAVAQQQASETPAPHRGTNGILPTPFGGPPTVAAVVPAPLPLPAMPLALPPGGAAVQWS